MVQSNASVESVPSGEINPIIDITDNRRNQVIISRLVNSFLYSIRTCFIMKNPEEESFRLLAIHEKRILADKSFRTVRGAKIFFFKKFKNRAWRKDVDAEWSYFYPPDLDWIEKMLSNAEKFS